MSDQKTPRVLDRDGNELKVGSRVKRLGSELVGEIVSINSRILYLHWWGDGTGLPTVGLHAIERGGRIFRRTYRCPDLLLLTDDPKRGERFHMKAKIRQPDGYTIATVEGETKEEFAKKLGEELTELFPWDKHVVVEAQDEPGEQTDG